MVISLAMILVLIVIMAFYNIRSKLNGIFIMLMAGVFILVFSLVMYITKSSYYNGILNIEVSIYHIIRNIKISVSSIKLMLSFGYMFIFISQINLYNELSIFGQNKKRTVTVVSALIATVFFTVNTPYVAEWIYLSVSENMGYDSIKIINTIGICLNYTILFYFIFMPMPSIILSITNTRLIFKKRHNTTVAIVIIIIEIIILLISVFTKIRNLMNLFVFNMFEAYPNRIEDVVAILPISIMLLLLVILFGVIQLDVFNSIDFFKTKVITKKMKIVIMDLKYIFHDFKNIMMTIIALKSIAKDSYGTQEGMEALEKIESVAYGYSEKVGQLLDIYKAKKIELSKLDIMLTLREAIRRINDEGSVKVVITDMPMNSEIYGDPYQLEILFYNILKNSVESIKSKKVDNGIIEISFIEETPWLAVVVTDNGGGMSKKELNRLWRPFKSTKNVFLNWGIGLCQAKNIMDAHLGHIDIISVKDKYTQVQMCFNMYLNGQGG